MSDMMNLRMVNISRTTAILAIGSVLIAGILLGRFLLPVTVPLSQSPVRQSDAGYRFIAPLLYISVPNETSLPEFEPFKKHSSTIVEEYLTNKSILRMSVYFRDLTSNQWFGINQNDLYSPASLLKVATLMTFLRMAEADPGLLSSQITIDPSSQDLNRTSYQYFPPEHPIRPGGTYTTQDLLSRMITESDNNAAGAFQKFIGMDKLVRTYRDLNLITSTTSPESFTITPATYSRIFRVLYNGTYLSHRMSEQVLDVLSQTTFTGGLAAGVPPSTLVSHKFGEWTYAVPATTATARQQTIHELHDCGIVYYPDHPYFLCVMTEGSAGFPTLESAIKDISAAIWTDMGRLHTKHITSGTN